MALTHGEVIRTIKGRTLTAMCGPVGALLPLRLLLVAVLRSEESYDPPLPRLQLPSWHEPHGRR